MILPRCLPIALRKVRKDTSISSFAFRNGARQENATSGF